MGRRPLTTLPNNNNNDPTTPDRYAFSVVGVVAQILVLFYACSKKRTVLAVALALVAVALALSGGALSESGYFIWECHEEDVNGDTYVVVGVEDGGWGEGRSDLDLTPSLTASIIGLQTTDARKTPLTTCA